MTGGMPFRQWCEQYGLTDPTQRVADLGCGPGDILRYLAPDRKPAFYLGLDMSPAYLRAAGRNARNAGLDAAFLQMDLSKIPSDAAVRDEVCDVLRQHRITRVLMLGVLHHIDDVSARATLDLLKDVDAVRELVTSDVVYVPRNRINNFFCDWDRGEHVRDEVGYDALAASAGWPNHRKFWTSPGLSAIKYLHYVFEK